MKKLIYLLLCFSLAGLIAGCGNNKEAEYLETTLSFDKDGSITDVIVESFDGNTYSEEGLKTFFDEKISDYNSTNIGQGEVELKELKIEDNKAKASLSFDSSDTYRAFYNTTAYYGTVNDAYDKGLISETVLKKSGSSETITKNDLMKMRDKDIIVLSEVVRVHSPKKIEYVSANVEVIGDKDARVSSDSTGLAYIVVN